MVTDGTVAAMVTDINVIDSDGNDGTVAAMVTDINVIDSDGNLMALWRQW